MKLPLLYVPKKFFKKGFILSILICGCSLFSQENDNSPTGSWMVFSTSNTINEQWSIPLVGILCYENLAAKTEFGFLRTGLTYKGVHPNLKLTLGAAYLDSQPLDHHEFETLTTQFWIYGQATLTTGKKFRHRIRLEHRWIDSPNDSFFNTRLRYRIQFTQPLGSKHYISCTDEPFFDFDGLHLNQNRFFLGLGRKLGKDISFEVGYFKTHIGGSNMDRVRMAVHFKTSFLSKNTKDLVQVQN